MNNADYEKKGVKKDDIIRITPIDTVPYADRELKVYELRTDGILYGVSTTCDGYFMPYSWIKSFRIIKKA